MDENEIYLDEQLFTIEEVCKILRVSRSKFHSIREDGFFNPPKYIGKSPRFTLEQIREFRDSLKPVPDENREKVAK